MATVLSFDNERKRRMQVEHAKLPANRMIHRRFLILLILLGFLVTVHPVAMKGGPAYTLFRVLVTGGFTATLWTVFRTTQMRAAALITGLPVITDTRRQCREHKQEVDPQRGGNSV